MKIAYSYIRFSTPDQRNGNSLERQLDRTRGYCRRNGLTLDESLKCDDGYSAYKGTHLKKGSLGDFLQRVKAGLIPKGTALVIENLDRLSRQGIRVTRQLIEQLTDAGIDVHVVSINRVFRAGYENDLTDYIVLGVESERAFKESQYKSERVGSAWGSKKRKAVNGHAITSSVPYWLKAEIGTRIKVIPDRAETVQKIFRLAAMGLGALRIVNQLTADGDRAFGDSGWITSYVKKILNNRAVRGEFQPYKKLDGKRIPDGDPIPGYFPAIVSQTEWDAVRKSAADKIANYSHPQYRGGGHTAERVNNLFTGLTFDATLAGRSVVYHYKGRGANDWEYLVTAYKAGQPANRMRYDHFEKAFLGFLYDLDWRAVAGESEPEEMGQLKADLDKVASEIDRTTRVLERNRKIIDDPDTPLSTTLLESVSRAEIKLAEFIGQREQITRNMEKVRTSSTTIAHPEELLAAIASRNRDSNEVRLRLRAEIRKRISRIDLHFGVEIITTTGEAIANVQPGAAKAVARIQFVNGVTRTVIFQGKNKILLS
jgi:DNA invertase Pin-like site-specific DNA recombinase